jgi:Family of unknown function (DUF5677)
MSAIEDQLQRLALKLDEPFSPNGDPDEVCMALGRRARGLHRGYIWCARGGYPDASRTLLRPALEINILLRFIRQRPEHRAQLWLAELDRSKVQIFEAVRKHRLVEKGVVAMQLPTKDLLNEWRRNVGRVRKAANDAGIPGVSAKQGPLIPPLREQVELLNTIEAWQAYATAYIALSSEQHVGPFSFLDADGPEAVAAQRALGSALFASTLVIVSDWLGLGITEDAEQIRLQLVGR